MWRIRIGNVFGMVEGDRVPMIALEKALTFVSSQEMVRSKIQKRKIAESLRARGATPQEIENRIQYLKQIGAIQNVNPICMFKEGLFPAGLLDIVLHVLGDDVEIVDETFLGGYELDSRFSEGHGPELREWQKEAIQAALRAKRGIINVGTGGGKTLVALHLIKETKKKFVYITERRNLVIQFASDLMKFFADEELGIEVGKVSAAKVMNQVAWKLAKVLDVGINNLGPNGGITTLASSKKLMDRSVGLVLFDEVHHAASRTARNVLPGFLSAGWRFGFTATVKGRSDSLDKLAQAYIGDVIYKRTHVQLREENIVCGVRVLMYPFDHCGVGNGIDDPVRLNRLCIVENTKRNRFITHILSAFAPNPVVVFVHQIKHGRTLLDMCKEQGLEAEFFNHRSDSASLYERLQNPRGIIIATKILTEGVNLSLIHI